jgi:hypothetical protein
VIARLEENGLWPPAITGLGGTSEVLEVLVMRLFTRRSRES